MYYSLTIDTEEEWDWNAGWPTDDLSVTNIHQLPRLQELCRRRGVSVTYFANQAVLDDTRTREVILELSRQEGVEIGMHIHPWNTPPLQDGPVTARQTFLNNLPPPLIEAKLNSVYDCFRRHGLVPTSFRCGRYSGGEKITEFLRKKDFIADSSVVPFTSWNDDGAPDYRRHSLDPDRLPPRFPGDKPFWVIPETLGFTRRPFAFWQRCYERIQGSWLRRLRLIGLAERAGLVRKVWLNFEDPLGSHMLPFLKMLRRLKVPYVCFAVHSSSLVAGKGIYTKTKADEDRLWGQMDEVFATLAGWDDCRPATISQIAVALEEQHHARTRN